MTKLTNLELMELRLTKSVLHDIAVKAAQEIVELRLEVEKLKNERTHNCNNPANKFPPENRRIKNGR